MALADFPAFSDFEAALHLLVPGISAAVDPDSGALVLRDSENALVRQAQAENILDEVTPYGVAAADLAARGAIALDQAFYDRYGQQNTAAQNLSYLNRKYGLAFADTADFYRYVYGEPAAPVVNDPQYGRVLVVGVNAREVNPLDVMSEQGGEFGQFLMAGALLFGAGALATFALAPGAVAADVVVAPAAAVADVAPVALAPVESFSGFGSGAMFGLDASVESAFTFPSVVDLVGPAQQFSTAAALESVGFSGVGAEGFVVADTAAAADLSVSQILNTARSAGSLIKTVAGALGLTAAAPGGGAPGGVTPGGGLEPVSLVGVGVGALAVAGLAWWLLKG